MIMYMPCTYEFRDAHLGSHKNYLQPAIKIFFIEFYKKSIQPDIVKEFLRICRNETT